MLRVAIKATVLAFYLLFCVFEMVIPSAALSDTCSDGTGVPPFLGTEAVTANLLLMIDNSYSMYDLVYAETRDECFDDSFNPAVFDYAGYFLTIDDLINNEEVWYEWRSLVNMTPGELRRFRAKPAESLRMSLRDRQARQLIS